MSDGPVTPENVATATRALEQASIIREAANKISVNVEVPPLVIPTEQKTMSEAAKEPISPVSETPAPMSSSGQKAKEAWDAAARFGTTVRKGDVTDLPAREAADAWDTANRLGKPVEEKGGSGDLLARMEKDHQLIDHSKVADTEVPPAVNETKKTESNAEQNPASAATPESPITSPDTTTVEPTAEKPGEVPLNPVKTAEEKQIEAAAEREAKIKADLDAKAKTEPEAGEAIKAEIAQMDKELTEKLKGIPSENQAKITRQFYLDKLVGYKVKTGGLLLDTDIITNEKGKIIMKINTFYLEKRAAATNGFLKSELENKIRGKTEETASSTKPEPVAPQAEVISPAAKSTETTAQGPTGQSTEKKPSEEAKPQEGQAENNSPKVSEEQKYLDQLHAEYSEQAGRDLPPFTGAEKADILAEKKDMDRAMQLAKNKGELKDTANEAKDPKKQYEEYLADLGYTAETGESAYDLLKLRNEKGEYVTDKAGKPFEFKFYSEANEFLKSEAEKKQAESAPASTPVETTKPEATPGTELTQEAKDLLKNIDKEKTAMLYVTENLSRILKENGISQEDIDKKTPQELMEILKNKKPAEAAPAPAPTETPKQ